MAEEEQQENLIGRGLKRMLPRERRGPTNDEIVESFE